MPVCSGARLNVLNGRFLHCAEIIVWLYVGGITGIACNRCVRIDILKRIILA